LLSNFINIHIIAKTGKANISQNKEREISKNLFQTLFQPSSGDGLYSKAKIGHNLSGT